MPPLSVMIKPASGLCNLRCKYCFYGDVTSLRDVPSYGVMTEKTAEKTVSSALEFADGETVAFAFQGGEPLLAGKKLFGFFVDTVKKYNTKNSRIFFSVQTNGTLIDDEWAEFFAKNKILVGLSLDGDFDANAFRVDEKGANSYYRILRGAGLLRKHGAEFNILSVLTGKSAVNCERIYRHLKNSGFNYIQFIPCLRPFGCKDESELYMTNEQYADFLIRIFNLYVKDFVRGQYVGIRFFDNLVRMYLGEKPEQCGMCGHCTHQFVAEANGNIYPCDFYCTDEYLLGNINFSSLESLAKSKKAEDFIKESLVIPDKCRICGFFTLCRAGGCKRMRADRDFCKAYKIFFSKCLPLFTVFRKKSENIN